MGWPEIDYTQTMEMWKHLVDVRFRLLALVPTLTATGVGLLGTHPGSFRVTLIAALGLVSVLGIRLYDLRNSELHDFAVHRLKTIEKTETVGLKRSARTLKRLELPDNEDMRERFEKTAKEGRVDLERSWPVILAETELTGGVFSERPPSVNRLLGIRVQHDRALSLVYTASIGAWIALLTYSGLARITDLDGNDLLWWVTAITAIATLGMEIGVAVHGAQDRYLKHVLTDGPPSDPWSEWDEPRSFSSNRAQRKVELANKAFDLRNGPGKLAQLRSDATRTYPDEQGGQL